MSQVQMFVPGLVEEQAAFTSQPPFSVRQEFTGAQLVPVPLYPPSHAHEFVPGPVEMQVALVSQPPLAVRHESMGEHVRPSPE